jgi:hypothetical protein
MGRWFNLGRKESRKWPESPDIAMKVSKVEEEYRFIRSLTCECGVQGSLKRVRQGIMGYEGRPMDVLEVECQDCNTSYSFYFDISDVPTPFGTMGKNFPKGMKMSGFFNKKLEESTEDEF